MREIQNAVDKVKEGMRHDNPSKQTKTAIIQMARKIIRNIRGTYTYKDKEK